MNPRLYLGLFRFSFEKKSLYNQGQLLLFPSHFRRISAIEIWKASRAHSALQDDQLQNSQVDCTPLLFLTK